MEEAREEEIKKEEEKVDDIVVPIVSDLAKNILL